MVALTFIEESDDSGEKTQQILLTGLAGFGRLGSRKGIVVQESDRL